MKLIELADRLNKLRIAQETLTRMKNTGFDVYQSKEAVQLIEDEISRLGDIRLIVGKNGEIDFA